MSSEQSEREASDFGIFVDNVSSLLQHMQTKNLPARLHAEIQRVLEQAVELSRRRRAAHPAEPPRTSTSTSDEAGELPRPDPDLIRAIARSARMSASDPAGDSELVYAGWKAGFVQALGGRGAEPAGDCGNVDCGWRGPISECSQLASRVGAPVGPLCPNCREVVEPDAAEPAAWVSDLSSPQPHCITKLEYRSWADVEAGVQYIPLYAAEPATLTDEQWQTIGAAMGFIAPRPAACDGKGGGGLHPCCSDECADAQELKLWGEKVQLARTALAASQP